MRALYVPVDDDVLELLGKRARAERRHPKDTASLILAEALRNPTERVTDQIAEMAAEVQRGLNGPGGATHERMTL